MVFCTTPFYDVIAPTIEDAIAYALRHVRRAQGVRCESRRALVVLTRDASLLVAPGFQTAELRLTDWEK